MANTYTKIYIHIVFTVQGRQNLIGKEHKEEILKYITGIFRTKEQTVIAINGMPDRIHVLIGWKPSFALPNLIRDVKAGSSKFINEKGWTMGKFNWQEGYGAFSYSHSHLDTVVEYIKNQEKHHSKRTFREEYLDLLKRFDVEYEEKYLFDWIS